MLPWEGNNSGLRINQFPSEQWLGVKVTAPAWLFLHVASSLSLCLPRKCCSLGGLTHQRTHRYATNFLLPEVHIK